MKKHKLLSLIAAASMAVSALASPASVIAADEQSVYYPTWQEAYFNMLKLAFDNKEKYDFTDKDFGTRFELYDVDSDGTPELFISEAAYHPGMCRIYTYRDGYITDSISLGTYGIVYCADTAPYLVQSDKHMGYSSMSYYELKDGKFVHLNSFYDNIDNAETEEVFYEVDGKKVSETEYVQAKEKYDHLELKDHGRKEHQYLIQEQVAMGIYQYYFDHYTLAGIAEDTEELNIPDTVNGLPVTEIKPFSVWGKELKTVKFGSNISVVGDRAFGDNAKLSSVEINDGIKKFGDHVFANCPSLENITGPSYSKTYFCKNGMMFYEDESKLKVYPSGRKNTDVIVPKTITSVLSSAFSNCDNIENITFSAKTKLIGEGALAYCKNLKTVTILSPDAVIENPKAFTENNYNINFTISNDADKNSGEYYFDGVIRGFKGSTAEDYAKKYNIKFEALDCKAIEATGDINSDGSVDSVDASAILSEYARTATGKESTFNEVQFYAADIDNNCKIDSVDASKILSYYSYLSTHDDYITIDEFFNMAM